MRTTPLLLVLDEPAANLDPLTEHALFERQITAASSYRESVGTVTVLITHRFSTVRAADLIFVLDKGRLSETGTHAELIRQGGLYSQLYEVHARGYRSVR